jgi:hypothetical protein
MKLNVSKILKSPIRQVLFSGALFVGLLSTYDSSLSAEVLCLKNKTVVSRKKQVVTKALLKVVNGTCPRGFRSHLKSA